MKRFALRTLWIVLLAGIAVYPLYLIAGNWYLRSGDLERRLNRRPERLLIQAGSAWTSWPGVIHVRDFRIRNQTRTVQWWAAMDRGTFHLRMLDLRDRELVIDGLSGTGVAFRLRRRLGTRRWVRPPRAELQPPIPGLSDKPEPARKLPPRSPAARRDPWRFRIAQVELDAVKEIWVDELRFAGEVRVAGGFDMAVWRRLLVDPTRLQIVSGGIFLGGGPRAQAILTDASGRIDGEMAPFSPAMHRGWNAVRFLSGRAEVEGTMASLTFLDQYFRRTRWLTLGAERSRARVDLRLRRGRILPASELEARSERLVASALEYRAEGPGRVLWQVFAKGPAPGSRLILALQEFRVTRQGHTQAHVRGHNLRIEALDGEPRLTERDLFSPKRIDIQIPEAEVMDLSFYNSYLPPRSGLELTGGSGRMSARLQATAPTWNGRGELRLDTHNLNARFEGRPLRGSLTLHTQLRDADFRGQRFDVSGSKLDLKGVTMPGMNLTGGPWWARVHLDRAMIEPGAPVYFRARVESTLSDPRPLFAFAAPDPAGTRGRVLLWMDDLLKVRGVGAVADVAVGDAGIAIDRMAVAGGPARIQGRLRFGGAPKEGILYATYNHWEVGVELDGDHRDWKILRPRKWFESRMGSEYRISGR
ncbi:MAG TPA: hypothetical protein VE078_15170 [Thermoanaerobaculia bacterium]|nr:hypothetical protein [Thermoanaerobaculia bacterium]